MAHGEIVVFWRNFREKSTPLLLAESLKCEHDMPGGSAVVWCGCCHRWVCLYCTNHDVSDVEVACFVADEPTMMHTEVIDTSFDSVGSPQVIHRTRCGKGVVGRLM